MIGAFADLWFRFVLQVWSLRPVERDRASSLWKRIIHSLMTLIIRNVGSNNAPQITCKLPNHIQNGRMHTKQHSSKSPPLTLWSLLTAYLYMDSDQKWVFIYMLSVVYDSSNLCDIHICCPKTLFAFVPLRTDQSFAWYFKIKAS